MDEVLPGSLLLEVLMWLDDESDLARCRMVSKRLRETVRQVPSVKLSCSYGRYLKTRRAAAASAAAAGTAPGDAMHDAAPPPPVPVPVPVPTPFKTIVTRTLLDRQRVEGVTLEMEDAIQRQPNNQDQEASKTDMWLTEPSFLRAWLPHVAPSLRRLSITDFVHQAQGQATPILTVLSSTCKELRHLELGNLSLQDACRDVACMPHLTSLTLECVGLGDADLAAIMRNVPALQSLSLISVFGLQELTVEGACLLSCCLILTSTPQNVTVRAPKLSELRLFLCPGPERLIIQAPMLASLEVFTEKRPGAVFAVAHTCFLKTLLLISPDLTCVTDFRGGAFISNMVFEAPILAFNESGAWEGILIQPRVRLPDFRQLSVGFPCLDTLFLGPGLWYAMESDADVKKQLGSGWPTLRKLVLHVLLINYDSSLHLLEMLVKSLPSLQALEMYFHSESNSGAKLQLISNMEERFNHVHFKSGTWKDLVWADHIKSSTLLL